MPNLFVMLARAAPSMNALELIHRLADHQDQVDDLLSAERVLICVGSRLLALSMVQGHLGMAQRTRGEGQTESLIGCVTTADEALTLVYRQRPSLVICTEILEDGAGISLIEKVKTFDHAIKTVLFLEHRNLPLYERALGCHSDGVLLEPLLGRGFLLLALRTVCEGGVYLEPEIGAALHGTRSQPDLRLSERELEVMQQVVHGLSDRQIAAHLSLAIPTVKHHLQQVYQKLAVRNRTRAAIGLLLMGLVDPPSPLLPSESAALAWG